MPYIFINTLLENVSIILFFWTQQIGCDKRISIYLNIHGDISIIAKLPVL